MGPYEAALRQAAVERRKRLMFSRNGRLDCENLLKSPALPASSRLQHMALYSPDLLSASSLPISPSIISRSRPRLTIHAVKARVADAFGISTKDKIRWLLRRSERSYSPRNIAMALAMELVPDVSLAKIAVAFGEKQHTLVFRACRTVEERCAADAEFDETVKYLRAMLRGNFEVKDDNTDRRGEETVDGGPGSLRRAP